MPAACRSVRQWKLIRHIYTATKEVYEVALPDGRRVAAKRCSPDPAAAAFSERCAEYLRREAAMLGALQAQYPARSLRFDGLCAFPAAAAAAPEDRGTLCAGTWLLAELGTALETDDDWYEDDLEQLRATAHRYQNFSQGPMLIGPDSWRPRQWVRTARGQIYQIDFDANWVVEGRSTLAVNCFNLLVRLAGLERRHKGATCRRGFVARYDTADGPVAFGEDRGYLLNTKWWHAFPGYKNAKWLKNIRKSSAEFHKLFRQGKITMKKLRAGALGAELRWSRHGEWVYRTEELNYYRTKLSRKRSAKLSKKERQRRANLLLLKKGTQKKDDEVQGANDDDDDEFLID